jgi:diphthamide synthase (EF-2-diphthine--ammonia ligase)
MAEDFLTNVARMIAATLYFSVSMQTAREMYGKAYFALGVQEKAFVDQAVLGSVASNYQVLTPENLVKQAAGQPAGFQVQPDKTT